MLVKQFITGGDRNFGYIAVDESTNLAVVIDPSYSPKTIYDFTEDHDYKIEYIFCTHNHRDHTNGNKQIESLSGVKPLFLYDIDQKTGQEVEDSSEFPLGKSIIKIIHTPGHTEDSICIYVGDVLFTGDTLFVGKVGGTYSDKDAKIEYKSLHEKILTLPDSTRIFPGHNYGTSPESTILQEKSTNPFLLRPDVDSFISLKNNWLEYKRKHGIK